MKKEVLLNQILLISYLYNTMSLIKNSIFNLSGFIIPTVVAIPSLGILARALGTELFGIFTLAFAVVGYASIFDAGLTRAVIREISLYRHDDDEQVKIISTASVSVLALGCIAGIILYFITSYVPGFLNVSTGNVSDVQSSFKVLAITIPVFLLNQIWLAYLEGHERFAVINIQRALSSSSIAAIPAFLVLLHNSLYYAILGLLVGRVISLIMSFYFSREIILRNFKLSKVTYLRLLKFGGWITISNVISPVMVYFDRFVISHLLGANKIAYYTAPSEAVSRLLNIPTALSRALFPKLSAGNVDRKKLEKLSYLLMAACCLPILIIGIPFAEKILVVWMGNDYAGEPAKILKILLIGFLFNAMAQIPFSKIQAIGKAHITASLHMLELVPYLLMLYYLTVNYALTGTAIAWSLRVIVDFFALFYLSRKLDAER